MAKYEKRVELWTLSDAERAALQVGQHVSAGGAPGRWCGQTRASDVVAYRDNARGKPGGARAYFRALRDYAKGRRNA